MVNALFAIFTWAITVVAPNTLVVCPSEYHKTLEPWVAYRTAQGYRIEIVTPADSSEALQATIAKHAQTGQLQYVLLIGDVPERILQSKPIQEGPLMIATHYRAAKVNVRFGSTPQIATDAPYADVDGNGVSDLAIGRISVDSADELSTVIEKIIRYEQAVAHRGHQKQNYQKHLKIVAGKGGFSPAVDRMIELTARQMIRQIVPANYQVSLTQLEQSNQATNSSRRIRTQLETPSTAWIFLGHGLPSGLYATAGGRRPQPVLSVQDLATTPLAAPSGGNPLAVLLACYAGAFDATDDCLAEELLVQPGGPIAVIAASRVSMPYGNTVFGYELLKAYFSGQGETLGQCYLDAQRSVILGDREEPQRKAFDQLARAMMPAPVDLVNERREHVQMYHLLGDPLLRIHSATPTAELSKAVEDKPLLR